ncbi:hypothetical protein J4410_04485 [Candidatus Woesearchaeota archaeon]|nr:hypothetical protein [Candidatus Woesearchaeota archaeon]
MKRDKLTIIYDVLIAIQRKEKIKPTHLLYKSNLSYQRMKEYLDDLMQKQLILEESEKGQKFFALTDKGHKFLQEYAKMREFTESFGL